MTKTGFFRKLSVIVAACALALALSGCGSMTLDKLMTKMDTALEGKEIYELSAAMELDATLNFDDEVQEITAELEMDVQVSSEHDAFVDMEIKADVAYERMNETMQFYVVNENEDMVAYIHSDSDDSWTKIETGMTYDELFASGGIEGSATPLFSETPENLVLADEIEIVENRESYVMTYAFTGNELIENVKSNDALAEAENSLSDYGIDMSQLNLDYSALNIPTTVYVDAETFLPVRFEFEVQGISEIINSLLDTVIDSITGVAGTYDEFNANMSEEDIDVAINITTANVVINDIGYDPVEVPSVPAEGIEAVELQNLAANGKYVIEQEGNTASVTAPEGWTAIDYSSDYVYLVSEDYTKQASYSMYTDITGDDFKYDIEEMYVQSYIDMDYYVSHGSGSEINGFVTMYIECPDNRMLYFAGAPIGDNGWLWIEMSDESGTDDMETALTPVIEAVEEYQL